MDETKVYETIAAAHAGTVHAEEIAKGLIEELRQTVCENKEFDSEVFRHGLWAIDDILEDIETLLHNLAEVRREEARRLARLDEIEQAEIDLAFIQRPELAKKELSIDEAAQFFGNHDYLVWPSDNQARAEDAKKDIPFC